MTRTLLLLLLFVFPPPLPGQAGDQALPLAITHINIIDGTGSPQAKDKTVLIKGGRISSIEPGESDKIPSDATIIDGRGKYLIPGLWDMHVHLSYVSEVAAPALLANGVTGVRDLGGDLDLIDWMRRRIAEGKINGPQIFRAGPFVDGSKPGIPHRIVVWNASDARDAVLFFKTAQRRFHQNPHSDTTGSVLRPCGSSTKGGFNCGRTHSNRSQPSGGG